MFGVNQLQRLSDFRGFKGPHRTRHASRDTWTVEGELCAVKIRVETQIDSGVGGQGIKDRE